jgi:2-iminoacetate synthase ThiH
MGREVTSIVDHAIAAAGLAEVHALRRAGCLEAPLIERLWQADLLALGALADRVRADEAGDEVRVYTTDEACCEETGVAVLPPVAVDLTGLELLRHVAVSRLTGPPAARVRVDWMRTGLELAQVALGFGANELAGRIANKRGLPIAADELAGVGKKSRLLPAQQIKQRELAGYVRRAGRVPIFVEETQTARTASMQPQVAGDLRDA